MQTVKHTNKVKAEIPAGSGSELKYFMLLALFTGLPVYWACLLYIEVVTSREFEELALAATICFFGFLYIGWILARVWAANSPKAGKQVFVALSLAVLAITLWMFIHADFQLHSLPAINLLLFWLPFMLLSLLLGCLINLSRISVQDQIKEANLTSSQLTSELNLLQSQLSPHFLFNTLNNLYGLSLTQHEKVPPLLLKLSELLRYSVYDAKDLFVPLKSELAYINNYIAFEQIRIGDRLRLSAAFDPVASEEIKIAPMLLITFIENAFKHAKNTGDKSIFVDIAVKTWEDRILFSVKNSYCPEVTPSAIDKHSGLGLANAAKRLALLYPDEHDLQVTETKDVYTVMLQLKAK